MVNIGSPWTRVKSIHPWLRGLKNNECTRSVAKRPLRLSETKSNKTRVPCQWVAVTQPTIPANSRSRQAKHSDATPLGRWVHNDKAMEARRPNHTSADSPLPNLPSHLSGGCAVDTHNHHWGLRLKGHQWANGAEGGELPMKQGQ